MSAEQTARSSSTVSEGPRHAWIEQERWMLLAFVGLPFVGFLAAVAYSWSLGYVRPVDIALLVVLYLIGGFGVTGGYHRLLTHRSFETNRWVRWGFAVAGSIAGAGPVLEWVAGHRCHHQHSDGEEDPHSPHHHGGGVVGMAKGLWHAHVGWIFEPPTYTPERYAPDLLKDRGLVFIDRTFIFWMGLGLAIPAAVGYAVDPTWRGALLGFLWGGIARIFLIHHVTWSINSVCHVFGQRPYESHDKSTNNFVCGLLGLGEGWHNNHHAFPNSARHGLEWWQLDLTWLLILALEKLGLAWDLKLPSDRRLERKAAA